MCVTFVDPAFLELLCQPWLMEEKENPLKWNTVPESTACITLLSQVRPGMFSSDKIVKSRLINKLNGYEDMPVVVMGYSYSQAIMQSTWIFRLRAVFAPSLIVES